MCQAPEYSSDVVHQDVGSNFDKIAEIIQTRKHSVDAFHLGVVEGTNLAPVARLNYFGDLVEVGADVLMDSGAGGAVLRLATHDTKHDGDLA